MDELESYLYDFKKVIKKHKKLACVSYGKIDKRVLLLRCLVCSPKYLYHYEINDDRFFSFNTYKKIPQEEAIVKDIKNILGNDAVYIDYQYATNIINETKKINYLNPYEYYVFLNELDIKSYANISFNLLEYPEKYNESIYSDYARYFSCAEKKLGLIGINHIYVTKTPCYLCLPYLKYSCTYLDKNNNLNKLIRIHEFKTKNTSSNTITNLFFRHVIFK